jgi:uncharacterized membrane protein (DUF373 family)
MQPLARRWSLRPSGAAALDPAPEVQMLEGMREAGAALESAASRTFGRAADLIVRLLVPLTILALMMGIARVFLDLWRVWQSPSIAAGFDVLVTDILSMFVVIELLKSIVEYFEVHRLKITFILDAALVFVLREVMIGLYKHEMHGGDTAALALMLLVMGALRIAAVRFSPPERRTIHAP